MLRVALVVPEFHGEKGPGGGINTMAESILRDLSPRDDVDVEVVSLRMSRHAPQSQRILAPRSWFRGPRVTSRAVGAVVVHDVGSWLAEWEPVRYFPRKVLTDVVRRFDVALVLSGSPAAALSVSRSGLPVVSYAASLVREERVRLQTQLSGPVKLLTLLNTSVVSVLDRRAVRLADVVLAINPSMADTYRALGAKTSRLLPPGLDTDDFSPAGARRHDGPILSVGRLSDPRKGTDRLIRAYASAVETDPDLPRLVLAGRLAPSSNDMALIDELGLSSRVDVVSPVPAGGLVDLYRSASQFVMASHEEGLGIVALEAMACGLPVVATNTEGSQFVLGSPVRGGIVVDRGLAAEAELAEGILALHRDRVRADVLGADARTVVVEGFSRAAATDGLVQVVRSLAARGGGGATALTGS